MKIKYLFLLFVMIISISLADSNQNMVLVDGNGFNFYIDAKTVTQKDYVKIMGQNPSLFKGADLPVHSLEWIDAIRYCNKRSKQEGLTPVYNITGQLIFWDKRANGYRLPTEAEWEYAASGGKYSKGFLFSGSNDLNEVSWNRNNARNGVKVSGLKKTNELNLYDMNGNVWQWCWDISPYHSNERLARGGIMPVIRSKTPEKKVLGYEYNPELSIEYIGLRLVRNN